MNFNDLQGLQEAYTQINQLDEVLDTPEKANEYGKKVVKSVLGAATKAVITKDKEHLKTIDKRIKGAKMAKRKAERKAAEEVKESYDLYDIILSYLLDEGYAETNEAALAIMANMSEEWRGEIVEETKRTEYLQKKFNKENQRKSGSALTHIPGKQNTGQALQKARQSERHMRGEK